MRKFYVLALYALCGALAWGEPEHLVGPGTTTNEPVASSAFDRNIEDIATKYLSVYPDGGDRVAFFDLGLPKDAAEYVAMGKNGIILVSAFSRDNAELPLARVFVRLNGNDVTLRRLWFAPRDVAAGSSTEKMFGPNRVDAFFLFPIELLQPGVEVICDFAANRQDFSLGTVDMVPADFMRGDPNPAHNDNPPKLALGTFIAREYPGIIPVH